MRGRSVGSHALAAGTEGLSIFGNSPVGDGDDFAIAFSRPFPFVRPGLADRPGVAILSGMIFPVEHKGLDVIPESEAVFTAANVFEFVGQAGKLTFVGIQFPLAGE